MPVKHFVNLKSAMFFISKIIIQIINILIFIIIIIMRFYLNKVCSHAHDSPYVTELAEVNETLTLHTFCLSVILCAFSFAVNVSGHILLQALCTLCSHTVIW